MIELCKFVIQPVVLIRDEDGVIVNEQPGQVAQLFTDEQVHEYIATIRSEVAAQNAQQQNGGRPVEAVQVE